MPKLNLFKALVSDDTPSKTNYDSLLCELSQFDSSIISNEIANLKSYYEYGEEPSEFIVYCLSGDYHAAEEFHDKIPISAIFSIASFIKVSMSSDCHGDRCRSKITKWTRMGGVFGKCPASPFPSLF